MNLPETARDLLAALDFEVDAGESAPDVRLASGAELEEIASEGTGGCYFLCGASSSRRPVLFASSEGQAGLIAADLTEALELIVAMPYWFDCLKFSAGGSLEEMMLAAPHLERDLLEDYPEVDAFRGRLRQELGLACPPVDVLLAKLHRAVAATEPDFVLLAADGWGYETLFNKFRVSDCPAWR